MADWGPQWGPQRRGSCESCGVIPRNHPRAGSGGPAFHSHAQKEGLTHPRWEPDHSLWDLEGSPGLGLKGICLNGTAGCTGQERRLQPMETWRHISASPHPGSVPLASQLPSRSLEGLHCRINRVTPPPGLFCG